MYAGFALFELESGQSLRHEPELNFPQILFRTVTLCCREVISKVC